LSAQLNHATFDNLVVQIVTLARAFAGTREHGETTVPSTITTRDIFAIGILGFRAVSPPLRHLHEVETAQLSENDVEVIGCDARRHPRGASA